MALMFLYINKNLSISHKARDEITIHANKSVDFKKIAKLMNIHYIRPINIYRKRLTRTHGNELINQRGLFTDKNIRHGTTICRFAGVIVHRHEMNKIKQMPI
ncbi:MAG: hypothetical protein GY928_14325 [Colwellia sp.]|nr:hypothetical protein [Colwellia sp.]